MASITRRLDNLAAEIAKHPRPQMITINLFGDEIEVHPDFLEMVERIYGQKKEGDS